MSYVAAAYGLTFGIIGAYVLSVYLRLRAARREAEAWSEPGATDAASGVGQAGSAARAVAPDAGATESEPGTEIPGHDAGPGPESAQHDAE